MLGPSQWGGDHDLEPNHHCHHHHHQPRMRTFRFTAPLYCPATSPWNVNVQVRSPPLPSRHITVECVHAQVSPSPRNKPLPHIPSPACLLHATTPPNMTPGEVRCPKPSPHLSLHPQPPLIHHVMASFEPGSPNPPFRHPLLLSACHIMAKREPRQPR
jgi:hypothetical protein